MLASHHRWIRRVIAIVALAGAIVVAGCASQRAAEPELPDEGMLKPATQALHKAMSAHADQFAPRIVDSARRRLTVARDILFSAAEADRPLTDAENDRVKSLVSQARIDAKAALIKTQAGAVQKQIAQLQSQNQNQDRGAAANAAPNGGGVGGLGISAFGSGNTASEGSQ